jgi:hypothetical protein
LSEKKDGTIFPPALTHNLRLKQVQKHSIKKRYKKVKTPTSPHGEGIM